MTAPLDRFTPRERQVVRRVGEGMMYQQVADDLGISTKTAQVHAANAAAKIPELAHLTPRPAILEFWRRVKGSGE